MLIFVRGKTCIIDLRDVYTKLVPEFVCKGFLRSNVLNVSAFTGFVKQTNRQGSVDTRVNSIDVRESNHRMQISS